MNTRSRTERIFRTMLVYVQYGGGDAEDESATIVDMLADLEHLADEYGVDFDAAVATAHDHYKAELSEAAQAS